MFGVVCESVRSGASVVVVGCDYTYGSTGVLWCLFYVVVLLFFIFKKCFLFYFLIYYVLYVVFNLSKAV